MKVLIAIFQEIWSLFVDDGNLALGLILWCLAGGLALPHLGLAAGYQAPLLAAGCLAILVANVLYAARR
ncbi:MAG: hypothetical protein P4L72_13935 [Parvibaculum sp.]|jgi:hypothetical protein|uniref:hypothetical protein n=1 Tax=Parvibaculum sp. TaxID=2024848 RepID=UPI00284B37A2|nr:hypothetical protein [Parvibaculum sp.]MDR3500317.1 hypothetical protein [Parvibaculum sp.]